MLSFHVKFVQTDRWTTVKQYAPDLLIQRHKNKHGSENASNQHIPLFPQCFLLFQKRSLIFEFSIFFLSANAFSLDQSERLSLGKRAKLLSNKPECE